MAPRLILTGFMGSGKTAVGRNVAGALGWKFFDADKVLEQQSGRSVSEIFVAEGEGGFRKAEEKVVLQLLDEAASSGKGMVIALGGGAVTIPKVFERLKKEELVVFLEQDVETAFDRSQNGKRPLAVDPAAFRKLYGERENLYRAASGFTVDVRDKPVRESAEEIIRLVSQRTGKS